MAITEEEYNPENDENLNPVSRVYFQRRAQSDFSIPMKKPVQESQIVSFNGDFAS